jgi:uncharacterized protein GlcG (DUF336 family)
MRSLVEVKIKWIKNEVGIMRLRLSTAEAVIAAAKAAVADQGFPPVSISVVDEAAHLIAFSRMDGTFLGGIDVAHRKARTAALFNVHSAVLGGLLQPGSPAYSVSNSNGGLIGIGGGVVLRDAEGLIMGAVGVSGGSVDEDEAIAQAASAAI